MFFLASPLGRSLVTPPPARRPAQGAQIYSEGVGRFQGLVFSRSRVDASAIQK